MVIPWNRQYSTSNIFLKKFDLVNSLMNSEADSHNIRTSKQKALNSNRGEAGFQKPYLRKVFVRSETGLYFVWAQPDWVDWIGVEFSSESVGFNVRPTPDGPPGILIQDFNTNNLRSSNS